MELKIATRQCQDQRGVMRHFHYFLTIEQEENHVDFYVLREAKPNPGCLLRAKLSLLWRPELAHIQELNRLPGYRQRSKQFVTEKILLGVPEEILRRQVSEELFDQVRLLREETGRFQLKK